MADNPVVQIPNLKNADTPLVPASDLYIVSQGGIARKVAVENAFPIAQFPAITVDEITGNEKVPLSQSGVVVQTTVSALFQAATILDRQANITATGTKQSDAYQLTKAINEVTTVASGTGVKLTYIDQLVMNRGVSTLSVYPPSGAQIETYGTNTAVDLLSGDNVQFICMSDTQFRVG